ncbi:MAG: phosphate ABC transporter permease subunit PstC [Rhodospirillaceae bacterium]|jgi:phosphate transport system permease protein|nr:phosphate ABC transporter permease subunit PstC [Rhodospirillaceae bacterium]MBT6404072.1 phosphate ABC transporter permease subunit PstC [Rhodospirillaceae bacterium]MBT6536987.1 phosphate ABC transporter permease subunit PstC [Rhodospirillaceae bacterium]MBT7361310.1 phosphate ABC transporter permease subunit PstC [Rhodospirillaceae bacterium]
MNTIILIIVLLGLTTFAYRYGRRKALTSVEGRVANLHSLPSYHGAYVALWCGLPALIVVALWLILQTDLVERMVLSGISDGISGMTKGQISLLLSDIRNLATGDITSRTPSPMVQAAAAHYVELQRLGFMLMTGAAVILTSGGLYFGLKAIQPTLRARPQVERIVRWLLLIASVIAILTTIGIILSLMFESIRFFGQVNPIEFLFGLTWSPQTALRADQVGGSGAFGAVPVFAGTLLITVIAMIVAVPIGLMAAIYMAEYASPTTRSLVKPALEILAGIPTVVYGFFAALTIGPLFRGAGESIGLSVASESALAAGLVMGVMIIPFVSSLSDDVINAVPQSLRDGSYALGATQSETIRQVILPASLHGIVGAILLAVSRAIGETMIVVMAAGLSANLTANPLEAVTTVTVQIVTLLVGDQEFDSAKTLAAFALGLVLFLVTLALNVVALRVVRKYREEYD